jgi:predicted XRE-type DNA-binding protein
MEGRTIMNVEIHENVWDALADTEQEAANLKARSALLYEIRKAVQRWGISQEEAAKRLGLTRPRINDLLRGKLAKFSLDALVNIATAARLDIEIRVKDAA